MSFHIVAQSKTGYVNPMIGTGGKLWASAMLSPAATAPFGMVKLGPDTRPGKLSPKIIRKMKFGNSGYFYPHNRILGFSHTRLQGTGARAGGFFRILPFQDKSFQNRIHQGLSFSHKDEKTKAAYYSVKLSDIQVELTASPRCGVHKYKSTNKKPFYLIFDSTSSLEFQSPAQGEITLLSNQTLSAKSTQKNSFSGRYGGLTAYSFTKFSHNPQSRKLINQNQLLVSFSADDELVVKTCLSYVSLKNARLNFENEIKEKSFNEVYRESLRLWEKRFSRIDINANEDVMKQFYTAVYHSMQMPTIHTDVNGEFLGFNQTTGMASDYTYVSDLSLWDTFRTTHPLYTLIAHDMQMNSVKSLLDMADRGGQLPRWPAGGGYAGSMFGSPANFVLAETYFKKIGTFDIQKSLQYMVKSAKTKTEGIPGRDIKCLEQGYCPYGLVDKSVSKTLEYAWADYIVSKLAKSLGEDELSDEFLSYSKNYKNLWDSKEKFFRAKNENGEWQKLNKNLLPYLGFLGKTSRAYAEGTPRQWRYSVPHAVDDLIEMFGGKQEFVLTLDNFFKSSAKKKHAALLPGAYYWHGNEHNLHAAYLFNDAGRPDLTQKWVRWALDKRYELNPNGYDGNDDGGTLSAWYILSSIGLYPQAGSDRYWIGSPSVNSARIKIGNKVLNITVKNQSQKNIYIKSVTLNGKPLVKYDIRHSDLFGELVFVMNEKPFN